MYIKGIREDKLDEWKRHSAINGREEFNLKITNAAIKDMEILDEGGSVQKVRNSLVEFLGFQAEQVLLTIKYFHQRGNEF